MKDVIKELVDIDEKAKLYSEETQRKKEELEKDIEAETKRVYEKHMEDAKAEVEAQKKVIEAEGERKFLSNKKLREEQVLKLQKKFDANADKWVKQIVSEVIG